MKKLTFLIVLFLSLNIYGQDKACRTDILNGIKVFEANKIENYIEYDYSTLWLKSKNEIVYGIIGDDHQRIQIKFLQIEKNIHNPKEYLVFGKTNVKDNVCDFVGKITIISIQEFSSENFGVDNMYKGAGIKKQGLLIAKYEFFENKNQNHSGSFQGTIKSKWYLDKNENIEYNDINLMSDGYFNNAFVGTWKMYNSKLEKECNWGDYRVPNSHCDFDIGVGEFNVAEKYWKKGWLDIALRNKMPNSAIIENKSEKQIKNWWE
jgi:hypothetical protein